MVNGTDGQCHNGVKDRGQQLAVKRTHLQNTRCSSHVHAVTHTKNIYEEQPITASFFTSLTSRTGCSRTVLQLTRKSAGQIRNLFLIPHIKNTFVLRVLRGLFFVCPRGNTSSDTWRTTKEHHVLLVLNLKNK